MYIGVPGLYASCSGPYDDAIFPVENVEYEPNSGHDDSHIEADFLQSDSCSVEVDTVKNRLSITRFMSQASRNSVQGAALYGQFLFQAEDQFGCFYVYDIYERSFLGKIPGERNSVYHCNNVNFSSVFYDENDLFPLIYVSQQHNNYHFTNVYRFVGDSIPDLKLQFVQRIIGPKPDKVNHLFYQDCVVDCLNGYYYLYGHDETTESDTFRIVRFILPPTDIEEVILTENDIIDSISFENSGSSPQGAVYHEGKVYVINGVPGWNEKVLLNIIDFDVKNVLQIDLGNYGFNIEPEGIDFWGSDIFCATNNKGVYRIVFNY